MVNVLVVDDDRDIREVIHVYLRNEGLGVTEASDGLEALKVMENQQVDFVILDIMMPNMDGIQACMKIRATSTVPVIMLSAKEEDMDKIYGLTAGADDYLTKPFNPMELVARVKAQLRRQGYLKSSSAGNESKICIRNLCIDTGKHLVSIKNKTVTLTPLEFAILRLLVENPGQVFSADTIYETVWKEPSGYSDNTVMVHIRNLREKLEEHPRTPEYIKTVWGVGYKIEA